MSAKRQNNWTIPLIVLFLLGLWTLPWWVFAGLFALGVIVVPVLAQANRRDRLTAAQTARARRR